MGFQRSYFLLSFDCDTERDIEVVEAVHKKIEALGISPIYAVPGELLKKGEGVYSRIASRGAEFINHGYYTHTLYVRKTRTYAGVFFYDQLPLDVIGEDVLRGHEAIQEVLGVEAKGFRTPHFGSYQKTAHFKQLHSMLLRMNYSYSSSSMPLTAFQKGPVWRRERGGFPEIPVMGRWSSPLKILDSWSFRFAPRRTVGERDYAREFRALTDYFVRQGKPGIFNIYADPSQIEDWPLFFDLLREVSSIALPSYQSLLSEVDAIKH